ncbi:MAG: UDP-glucose 6-dehydrogenase [Candidatus Omnitrophica bacterium CG11_big_fil_rev_8_21_14_0_20_41_12]|nr:MAG: UDP-glucose 6-dehydrogenase [Candidatus Omnitrophica bacterium CG11_big_fil_rev_8_21_14_0_20_41_12]
MNISIIGSGYVGLVSGACFAELGNNVICADNDVKKISELKKGVIPIYEPGLEELICNNLKKKRLKFTSSIKDAVKASEVIFIAVGTPSLENGEADLTGIENVARTIAQNMNGYRLIVEKSTVPVETCSWVKKTIAAYIKKKYKFDVVSNPEFLREGSAINDFTHPDRIVVGVESAKARQIMTSLYQPLNRPILVTNIKSAELIKHASNAFLATKISFINALSQICDRVGANVKEVAQGMGLDNRIGRHFLHAGIGYGGSCFPKDLDAFITIAEKIGYDFDILKAVRNTNEEQKKFVFRKIKDALWIIKDKSIAVLGLAFKANTDDLRNSPSIDLINALVQEGAKIKAYDPKAMEKAKRFMKDIVFCKDPYQAVRGADCLIVATEWNEFKELDFIKIKKALKHPLVVDARNIYDPGQLKKLGFTYIGVGSGNE